MLRIKHFAGSRATGFSLPFLCSFFSLTTSGLGLNESYQAFVFSSLIFRTVSLWSFGLKSPYCLHTCWKPEPCAFRWLLLFSRFLFTIYHLVPPSPLLRQGGPILWHITQPHTRTQKRWPASCWWAETVFSVTPFWRGRLIPLQSGCVCLCMRVYTHMPLNMFASVPRKLLIHRWEALPEIEIICFVLCALSPR